MADPKSALQGAVYRGFASVEEAGLQGMITLRGDLASARLAEAVTAATGCALPGARGILSAEGRAVGWMSPDELLLLVPHAEAPAITAALEASLAGEHALVANVSDARAMFRVRGAAADQAMMKLCPVDFATLKPGDLRRTRAAQVAGALWRSGAEEITLITFRSVAAYVMGVLEHSARPGSEIFPS